MYSPVLGRFISADTIVPDAGDPQSWNSYSYTRNNPINRIDPSGHADVLPDDGGIGDLLGALNDLYKGTPMERVIPELYEYQSALRQYRNAEAHFAYIMKFHVGNAETAYNALDRIAEGEGPVADARGRLINALAQEEFTPVFLADPAMIAGLAMGIGKGVKDGLTITAQQLKKAVGVSKPTWPATAAEMDTFLGLEGERIPDGSNFPGRGKVVWKTSDKVKITYEQHPYHANAPEAHKGPHWHLDTPGMDHQRYLPGQTIPGY